MKDERIALAPGALTAPLPPVMVTVGDMEDSNVLTVAWTGILATVPPKTYVSVRPQRHSYGMLKTGGEFVINLPPASLAKTVDFVGIYTGAKVDKFKKCSLTKKKSAKVAPPTIAECPIALECVVTDVMPMGSHDVFVADIVAITCDANIIDSEGKMHFERADLLAYAHGEYYSLGERIGRFGFSTEKPAKPPKKTEKTNKTLEKQTEKEECRPFYENAPRTRRTPKKPPSQKGAPHGKRKRGNNG